MNFRDAVFFLALGILLWFGYRWWRPSPPATAPSVAVVAPAAVTPTAPPPAPKRETRTPPVSAPTPAPTAKLVTKVTDKRHLTLNYKIDDGIVTVLGDVAVGMPTDPNAPAQGMVELLPFKLWPSAIIPYYIQPSVVNPERIHQAFQLFQGTNLRFVELTNQPDAMIFDVTDGVCKSYLGRVGGKQPVWIAPNCGPPEIAHEILHALGFVHEQNRADRDDFITVHFDNIEDQYRFNFEKLPKEFMRVSGNTPFDFNSLMLYPAWMFATGGQSTMESKLPDQRINPGQVLSKFDLERVNRIYQY